MSTQNVIEHMLRDLPGEAKLIIVIENNEFIYRVSCPNSPRLHLRLTEAMDEVDMQLRKEDEEVKS